MDLKKIDVIAAAEKGFEFTIKEPSGDETDIVIEVLGAHSRIYKQENAKIEAYKEQQWKRGKQPDQEILEEKHIAMFAACTKGWKGIEEDGKAVPFSKEEAVRIYAAYPVIANQVIEAVHNVVGQLEKK